MYQQTAFYFNKYRIVLAGIFAFAFILLISAIVTHVGNNSLLSSNKAIASSNSASVNPDVISSNLAEIATSLRKDMLTVGRAIYRTCFSINNDTNYVGKTLAAGSLAAVQSVGNGAVTVNAGINSATADILNLWSSEIMFAIHFPGNVIASITHVNVSNIVQPTDNNPVPVINTNLSAAELAAVSQEIKQNAENEQKAKVLQAAQAAANRGLDGVLIAGDPRHGGYPTQWDEAPQDSEADSWGMLNRECVSYAAWKVYQTYGYMPFWGGIGNANEWVGDAREAGIATGNVPKVHSVAISMSGYYGHAMWVEKVQGNMIYVSQYNYDMRGHYSEMWVNGSYFTYIYFQ